MLIAQRKVYSHKRTNWPGYWNININGRKMTLIEHEKKSTYSSVAFLIGGIITIVYAIIHHSVMVGYVGFTQCLLGIVSAGWHWKLTYFWEKQDEIGMIAFFVALFCRQLSGIVPGYDMALLWLSVFITIVMGYTHRKWDNDSIGLLAIINLVLFLVRAGWVWFVIASIIYAIALYFGRKSEIKGSHKHKDQWHWIWHVIAAVANTIVSL